MSDLITITDPELKPHAKAELQKWQKAYATDDARFCFLVGSVQTGKSHAGSFKQVRKRLKKPGLSIILSASDRQSKELAEKAAMHLRAADTILTSSVMEGTTIAQHEIRINRNKSRLIFLPANPDTARGFTGDVLLDEFALHRNAKAIFAAMMTRATRGFDVDIMSTFKGKDNEFYRLAKLLGLHLGADPGPCPIRVPDVEWSGHWVSILKAINEGLKVDFKAIRNAILDEAIISQEYLCIPMASGEEFIPLELVLHCESEEATTTFDFIKRPNLFAGMDIGRKRDRTVIYIVEKVRRGIVSASNRIISPGVYIDRIPNFDPASDQNFAELMRRAQDAVLLESAQTKAVAVQPFGIEDDEVFITRGIIVLDQTPFEEQLKMARAVAKCVDHFCVDAGGIGANLAENLKSEFPSVAEEVTFNLENKEYMAVNAKLCMERGLDLIPESPELRVEFPSLKRFITATGRTRFDAARTELGHADRVWAHFLALNAAGGVSDYVPYSECGVFGTPVAGGMLGRDF